MAKTPIKIERAELDALRREREELTLQIEQSRETIEQSLDLLRLLDELLAGGKP
jgi:hypothetical protein